MIWYETFSVSQICNLRFVISSVPTQPIRLIPEGIVSPVDVEVKNENLDTFHKDKFIEIILFYLEAKSIYTYKGIVYNWMNKNIVAKYRRLSPFSSFSKFVYCGTCV